MNITDKIYIAGHTGMVGSAIVRNLNKQGYHTLLTCSSEKLDLRRQKDTERFFEQMQPDYVFLAAAKVGGIMANIRYGADFMYDNIMIQANVIHAAYKFGVKKLLFLGSSCIYPKHAPQPICEEYLLSGYLEPSNQSYALAKIAGLELCRTYWHQYQCRFIAAMPCNLYGDNDHYDPDNAHVLPALLRKMHEAKKTKQGSVVVWGTGKPRREFLHVDDLAQACILLMQSYESPDFVNVGTGTDISIADLAQMIKRVVGFKGELFFDHSKPDGTPRKVLCIDRIRQMGWKAQIELEEGINITYENTLKKATF